MDGEGREVAEACLKQLNAEMVERHRALYEETGNPLYVWRAVAAIARLHWTLADHDPGRFEASPPALPFWCLECVCGAAIGLADLSIGQAPYMPARGDTQRPPRDEPERIVPVKKRPDLTNQALRLTRLG